MVTFLSQLGPYRILRQIGQGGMAYVFLATDTRTDQMVALRVVNALSAPDPKQLIEAEELGAQLHEQFCKVSAFVPAVYEQGRDGDYFFLAMEYIDGDNLSTLIGTGLPLNRALSIARDLCRFVEEADRFDSTLDGRKVHSLVHGDLTPNNVRITSTGDVKILDFGIAKALSLSRRVTRNDFGNLPYMSPERLDTNDVDRHADFWALGVMLYEMVDGNKPFNAPDTRRLERWIRERRRPRPLGDTCPPGLQAVIAKLLAPSVASRYDNASDIREDLDRVEAHQQTVAEREGWPGLADAEPATRRTTAPEQVDEEPTRRTPRQAVTPSAGPSTPDAAAKPAAPRLATKTASLISRLVAGVLLVLALLVGNEMRVSSGAQRVASVVTSRELDDMGSLWDQYDALNRRSYLGVGTISLRRSLTAQTMALAERVNADYRLPNPSVKERQWKTAREALARAVAARPDNQLKAAMRYCDGHLHRINGDAAVERHQAAAAHREFTDSVVAFREAAELRPNWPDPFLGLARTFIYGLDDVDRGADAFNQAQRLGYVLSERENAQLADGYRARGDTLAASARKLRGMPQESELLTQSADAYRLALGLYLKVVAFGDASSNLMVAQRALDRVERRRAELQQGTSQVERPEPGTAP